MVTHIPSLLVIFPLLLSSSIRFSHYSMQLENNNWRERKRKTDSVLQGGKVHVLIEQKSIKHLYK